MRPHLVSALRVTAVIVAFTSRVALTSGSQYAILRIAMALLPEYKRCCLYTFIYAHSSRELVISSLQAEKRSWITFRREILEIARSQTLDAEIEAAKQHALPVAKGFDDRCHRHRRTRHLIWKGD